MQTLSSQMHMSKDSLTVLTGKPGTPLYGEMQKRSRTTGRTKAGAGWSAGGG